jgi:hypothetical protein
MKTVADFDESHLLARTEFREDWDRFFGGLCPHGVECTWFARHRIPVPMCQCQKGP